MRWPLLTLLIAEEDDVVAARQRARAVAEQLGFGVGDQTRIATAVSEIARNAFGYAGRRQGRIRHRRRARRAELRDPDHGPGRRHRGPSGDPGGHYQSPHGLGIGLVGARRLMDRFDIRSAAGQGTAVTLAKSLPGHREPLTSQAIASLSSALMSRRADDPREAVREQNRELLRSLADLAEREEEAQRLNGSWRKPTGAWSHFTQNSRHRPLSCAKRAPP